MPNSITTTSSSGNEIPKMAIEKWLIRSSLNKISTYEDSDNGQEITFPITRA